MSNVTVPGSMTGRGEKKTLLCICPLLIIQTGVVAMVIKMKVFYKKKVFVVKYKVYVVLRKAAGVVVRSS